MQHLPVKFKRVHQDTQVPAYATAGAACIDLSATSGGTVPVGGMRNFGSGLAFEIPPGFVMLVFSRSGHGFKNGVRLPNCVGIIDSDYRGEVSVGLHNDGQQPFVVNAGDRIAQALILPLPAIALVEADQLSDTERGDGGFGSTGVGGLPSAAPTGAGPAEGLCAATGPQSFPIGVTYSEEHDTFADASGVQLGSIFHAAWHPRRREFPPTPTDSGTAPQGREMSDRDWAALPAGQREGCTTSVPGVGEI